MSTAFRLALVLLVALAAPTAAASAPPPGVDCDITIKGSHGGASGIIHVGLDDSGVRTRAGWWADLGGQAENLTAGDLFSVVTRVRLACNARRRYRLLFEAIVGDEVYRYTHYYPSESGFTQETTIDLGDVSRFFDAIEPMPEVAEEPDQDVEPSPDEAPVTLDLASLAGEWVRSESNNDPNDGMIIRVEGDGAVMTFVPESAGSSWREGDVLWRGVVADGSLRVRGSDGNFYPAQLEVASPSRLALRIGHGGAGNVQTWERGNGACWSDEAMASRERTPGMWVRFSTALPDGFTNALLAARDAQAAIQTAALTPDHEWVVVAANQPCYSPGFPSAAREWIDRYIASGREIDVVAFGPGGRWLIVAEDFIRRTTNVSDEIAEAIRRAQENDWRVTSFAFSPHPDERWALSAGGRGATGPPRVAIPAAIRAAEDSDRPVHEIAIGPDDGWVLIAEDWFASRGMPASLLEQLERYRTDGKRRIDHVVLHEMDGQTRWAIISNGEEPTPDPGDLINLVEQQLTGDSTMYQRMKTHRITGLAMALVDNNRVAWVRSYGLQRAYEPESYVYPSTIFDAASISKPVSYAAAFQLVEDGDLDLTRRGILYDLSGNDMPSRSDLDGIRADEIHLAHLLNHCAGIQNEKGNSGAQAITPGDPMPTYRQIFRGSGPAASGNEILRVDSLEVGEMLDYSGANSILIQALMETHASGGYDGQMQRLLDDLDMTRSTFRRDFPQMIPSMASGHLVTDDGEILTTLHKAYPNQAAAGLRTTAGDLAHFVILLNQDGVYDGKQLLDSTTVAQFIGRDGAGARTGVSEAACASPGNMRLGIRANNQGTANEEFWHGGLHNGYRTWLDGLPGQQAGVVILITGSLSDANAIRDEIRDAIQAAYGWRP